MATYPHPRRRITPVRAVNVVNFNGGLNLRRDQFQLAANESPDLQNVDIDPRGGFRLRGGTSMFSSSTLTVDPTTLAAFYTSTGTLQIVATQLNGASSRVDYTTGGAFSSIQAAYTGNQPVYMTTMNDLLYLCAWTDRVPFKWSGAAKTDLTANAAGGWQEDYAAPAGGHMPSARFIQAHAGFMWVGYTSEDGTAFPSRIRFSHPGRPEDYRSLDYIDVGLHDGDVITGLASFADRLLVFKNRSTWEVTGYAASSFAVRKLLDHGCVDQRAAVVSDVGVFWFSQTDGVYWYDGKHVHWIFEPLKPAIEDGTIPQAYMSKIRLGWGNRRLWVGVPYSTSATDKTSTFVWDPSLEKNGAWTRYDLKAGPFIEYQPPSAQKQFLGTTVGSLRILRFDQSGLASDDFGSGATNIASYYVTKWFDLGSPAIVKRWKRPLIISKGGFTDTITVGVYRNYDYNSLVKTFLIQNVASGLWGAVTWGGFTYTGVLPFDELDKGGSLGRNKAISLKFTGPTAQNASWGVDAITLKYIAGVLR